jgi:hypothetical protein
MVVIVMMMVMMVVIGATYVSPVVWVAIISPVTAETEVAKVAFAGMTEEDTTTSFAGMTEEDTFTTMSAFEAG